MKILEKEGGYFGFCSISYHDITVSMKNCVSMKSCLVPEGDKVSLLVSHERLV